MCFQVVLAYEVIVLCKCSGKYIDIYFKLKITYLCAHTYIYLVVSKCPVVKNPSHKMSGSEMSGIKMSSIKMSSIKLSGHPFGDHLFVAFQDPRFLRASQVGPMSHVL